MRLVPSEKGDVVGLIKRYLHENDTAVDVGAAIGEITAIMAQAVGPTGRVLAIEADPGKTDALRRVQQTYPWVDVMMMGAGESAGEFQLHRAGSTQASRWHGDGNAARVVTVPMPLDALVPYDRVDLVKMDVQGSEAHILDGAPHLLARCPVWIVELWPWGLGTAHRFASDVVQRFREAKLIPRWANGAVIDDAALKEFDGKPGTERHGEMRNIVAANERVWWNICAVRP